MCKRSGSVVALGVLVALVLAGAARPGGFPHFGAGCSRDDFTSGGTTIRAELCRAGSGPRRAVVVLHGCGGFSTFDHRLVAELPRFGISTLDVDYFAPTPPPGVKGFCNARSRARDAFPSWVEVARDAGRALRGGGVAPPTGVGVVGWSLGGAVAIEAAAAPTGQRIFAAVAAFSTGGRGATPAFAALLPPTILLSAGTTDAIPLAETLPLFRALRAAHVASSLYVYPHGSHDWPGRQGTLGIRHAAAFLRAHLG
jgi:dienelactone hydrolase